MPYASAAALTLIVALLSTACGPRVTQQGYGRCGLVPLDSAPLGEVVAHTSPNAGELRVKARLREGAAQTYLVTLLPVDSAQPKMTVTTDTVATFRELRPGAYRLQVRALSHSARLLQVELAADSGRELEVPMRYGGVSICEDGIRLVSRPWWRPW